ncbi:energy transducer TonB [Oerskovia sp. Sa1BUA8]|uniref:Energy transducer TonB n=1 Tax=Oerskovia douganii TaxID=2762210 RepID=A0A9D5UCV7_9CELL|nr:Rv3235 family protein [Oerskovia douganii]MBE7700716.1 energy transducer TonB [Oerskovia douganii]
MSTTTVRHHARPIRSGAAPLLATPATLPPAVPRAPRVLTFGRAPQFPVTEDLADDGRPVSAAEDLPLPDPTSICCSVVRAAVEVLRGERPVGQLQRWLAPDVFDALGRRALLMQGTTAPTGAARPVAVRRARLVRLGDTTAEATVVLEDMDRVRAAALRLEARRGVWRVVVLEIG